MSYITDDLNTTPRVHPATSTHRIRDSIPAYCKKINITAYCTTKQHTGLLYNKTTYRHTVQQNNIMAYCKTKQHNGIVYDKTTYWYTVHIGIN